MRKGVLMRRLFFILILTCLILSLAAQAERPAVSINAGTNLQNAGEEMVQVGSGSNSMQLLSSSDTETTLQFGVGEFKKIKVDINSEDWYHIVLAREGKMLDAGYPELPVFNRSIIIGDNAKMKLEVYDVRYEDIKLPIAPSKGNLTRDIDPDTVPYTFGEVYTKNEFYPGEVATLSDPYIMRDVRGIVIRTNPFAYNPVTQTLRVYTSYKVRVYADGIDDVNVLSRTREEISRAFVEVYENHFVNWNPSRYTSISDSYGKFLIIYHDAFEDQAEVLLQWKRQKGILGYFIPFSTVGTTAANLQTFIQTYYGSPYYVDFVILIGDAAQIPTLSVGGGGSDPSFALVAGADSYPDLFVSRLSATTAADVTTQVNKIITYERDYTTAQNWIHWSSGIASAEGGGGLGDDGESDIQHIENIRLDLEGYGYSVDQLYDPGVTDTDVSNVINWGTSLINYCGHGSTYSFTTSGFDTGDVAALTNGVMYPMVNAVACQVGNFVSYTCLAEAFVRKSNGGGVAFWGSSINQPWNPPMAAQDEVVDLLVAESKKTVGGLFFNGACRMLDDYPSDANTLKTWNIFGDCSMLARTKDPIAMTVTHTTVLNLNVANTVTVNTGVPYSYIGISIGSVVHAWGYANASGVFTTTITPSTFTEYTVTVTAHNRVTYVGTIYAGHVWTGAASNVWTGWANWNCSSVPTSSSDVLIPGSLTNYPSTISAAGSCKNLTVNSGASVTVSSYNLHVYDTAKFYGQLQITGSYDFNVDGDILWYSGSTANITNSSADIYCAGNMTFNSGSNVQFAMGYIEFDGAATSYITNYSSYTRLYNIRSDITSGYLIFDSASTQDFVINGSIWNYDTRNFYCYYTGNVILKGNLNDYNTGSEGIKWFYPTLIMDGTSQNLNLLGSSCYVNNLTISSTSTVSLQQNLTVRGKLRIESGIFSPGGWGITLGGDWENVVGPTAFTEGTSTVIFNGSAHQYCNYTETFNAIVVDKSGGALRVNSASATVTCASYDWVAGAVDVLVGTFTANDLVDNGLYGSYYVNPGATINLHQGTTSYIDLNGNLIFSGGGTINVYGGDGTSWWPYAANGSITMNGGILNFIDSGIYVATGSYTFTDNITGGTIKTSRGFIGDRTDFNPTGGTIELYGSVDCNVSHGTGSNFYNLKINKSASRNEQINEPEFETDRFGNTTPLTRTNQVTATSNLDINGYFVIDSGTFVAPAVMNVASYWHNWVGPDAFVEGVGLVVFDGTSNVYVYSENFNNLELNKPGTAYIYITTGQTVTSNDYNWTSGKLYVNGGTFTALDMFDSYIYGTIQLDAGIINFHQEVTQYLDLQADVTISGGELHLYGIWGDTYWPFSGNASLTMSAGLIEVHDTGVLISASNTFTTNITGGTIKIAKNLSCGRADFNPTGTSEIEFYTSNDSYINMTAGTLNKITVNKAARAGVEKDYAPVLVTDRDGNETLLTRTNSVILSTDVTCYYMLVNAGTFNPNGHTLNSNTHVDIQGTVIMNNSSSKIDAAYDIYWYGSSVASATYGTFECGGQWYVFPGANVVLPVAVNTYLIANSSRTILLQAAGTQFGTLYISGTTGTPVYTIHNDSTQDMVVAGDLIIGSGNELDLNLTNLTVNGEFYLDGKLDIHATTASVTYKPYFANTSILNIDSGHFIFYDDSVPRSTELFGTLSINTGTFEAVNNTIYIMTGSVNSLTSGNIICDGINATAAGNFQPVGGTVTITSNVAGGYHNLNVSNGNWLPNLTLNTATGVNLAAALTVKGNITITDGKLDLNAYTLYCHGDINVYDLLEVDAGAILSMEADNVNLNIKSGGRLDALGNSTYTALLTNPSYYTNYNIESGGTIAANYATFRWSTPAGVYVHSGAIIDTSYPLSNCAFQYGTSGGTLLTLNNNQNLAIHNASFVNSGGLTSNVKKTVITGFVNFINAAGTFAGEAYDDDIFDRVWWTTNATPGTPDLQVLKAVYSDPNPNIGETVTCTVTYVNASTTATGVCYLDLYWNEADPPVLYEYGNQTTNLMSVPAGIPQVYVFSVTPDASWAGTWNSYIQIDADGFVVESNEANNVLGPFNITWNMVALPAIDDLTIAWVTGTSQVHLDWTYTTTVDHFNIYRSFDPYFIPGAGNLLTTVAWPATEYTDTASNRMYFYVVTAESGAALAPVRQTGNRQRRN